VRIKFLKGWRVFPTILKITVVGLLGINIMILKITFKLNFIFGFFWCS